MNSTESTPVAPNADWEALVQDQVRRLRFGAVQIIVHEGRVTQVDTTERFRFQKAEANR